MAISYHAMTAATDASKPMFTPPDMVLSDGLQKRDVSDMLDLLALADTPFLNRVTWGPESGGLEIEWITENLGPGYVVAQAAKGTGDTEISILFTTVEGMLTTIEAVKQLTTGTMLYGYDSGNGEHGIMFLDSISEASCTLEWLSGVTGFTCLSVTAADKLYVLGAVANEGSLPREGQARDRGQCSNQFNILRKDVSITGSMANSDYYAVSREDRHQILMRLKEMQRERERVCLYSGSRARTSTIAGTMHGCLGFLASQAGTHIDTSTTSLLETSANNVINELWENGSRNLSFFGALKQIAKFTQWDKNRIRMRPNEGLGGGHITTYLSESGIEIELIPMAKVPVNIAFMLDTSKIHPRAKRNRKAIMEQLGKKGDFDAWQIISEFSMEMRGYNLGQHGMFTKLS